MPWHKKLVYFNSFKVIHISLKTNFHPSFSHFSTKCHKLVNNLTTVVSIKWLHDQIFHFNLQQDSLQAVYFWNEWSSFPCIILLVYGTIYKVIFMFIWPYFIMSLRLLWCNFCLCLSIFHVHLSCNYVAVNRIAFIYRFRSGVQQNYNIRVV